MSTNPRGAANSETVTVRVAGNHDPDASGRTPGPWFIESHGIMDATRSRTIVMFGDSDQDDADALLIAAAPDLLAALIEARAEVDKWGYGDFHYGETPRDPGVLAMLARIDAVLAKVSAASIASSSGDTE